MLIAARSFATGIVAFAVAAAASWLVLFGFAALYLGFDVSSELIARFLALQSTVMTIAVALGTLLGSVAWLCPRLRSDYWVSLGTAAVLTGAGGYWLLAMLTVVNGCALDVPFPLAWDNPCGR